MAVGPRELKQGQEQEDTVLLDRLEEVIDVRLRKWADGAPQARAELAFIYHELGPFGCTDLSAVNQRALEGRYREAGWSRKNARANVKDIRFTWPTWRGGGA